MNDPKINDFERRLQERTRQHQTEQGRASQELFGISPIKPEAPPDLSKLPFDEAIAVYDEWLTRKIGTETEPTDALGVSNAPVPTPLPTLSRQPIGTSSNQGRLQPIHVLEDIDRRMGESFALQEFLSGPQVAFPGMTLCESLEAIAGPLASAMSVSSDTAQSWIAEARCNPAAIPAGNPLSRPAIHLYQQGTYVNLWQLTAGSPQNFARLLQRQDSLRQIVRTVAAERWGIGFMEHYAEWGTDLHAMQLGSLHLAQRLRMKLPSSSQAAQATIIAESALFTEAGWAGWIGEYLARRAIPNADTPAPPKKTVKIAEIWDAFRRLFRIVPLDTWSMLMGVPFLGLDRLVTGISETLNWLLLNTSLEARVTNWHMRRMQRTVIAIEPYAQQLGFSLHQMLAQAIISKVEAHLGAMLVPYAVLLAANLDFEARGDAENIRKSLDDDAWQNVDARLLLLTKLDRAARHNVTTLMSVAIHDLGMRPLVGMRWT